MRNPDRIPVWLAELEAAWEKNPDLRLGQLLVNAYRVADTQADLFYIEDDVLLAGLLTLLRGPGVAALPEAGPDGRPLWRPS